MVTSIRRKPVLTGLRIFVVLTILGLLFIFYREGTKETIRSLAEFRLGFFVLAGLLTAVDLIVGAVRVFIFIRKITDIPDGRVFRATFRANLANIFLAAVTPFQTGGGLAQIYVLHRAGIPASAVLSVSVINFVATLGLLLVAGLMVLRWLPTRFEALHFDFILSLSSYLFYLVTALFVIFLFRPMILARAFARVLSLPGTIWPRKSAALDRLARRFDAFVQNYHAHISYFWRNEKLVLFHNLWLTVVLYFNKCFLAYVVLRGMGLQPGFVEVIFIQILLIFLIYFAPTPGASFLAETGAAALMSLLIADHLLAVFSLLWRFFTTYFSVIVGGIILMRAIGSTQKDGVDGTAARVVKDKAGDECSDLPRRGDSGASAASG